MKHESIALGLLVLGVMMGGIDTTIVVLAMPTMMAGLNTDLSAVVWAILIYILVVTILATQVGRLGDIRGRTKMFNLGMLTFATSSALASVAKLALSMPV
jgi:MFS family permease